ncbi:MAG: threonine ammonia-lyase [Thermoplasmata archaeon]|nr:threonine ammonia-lyase [Thermoplasmata archaeon]
MSEQFMIGMTEVMEAEKILRNIVKRTPVEHSRMFSEMSGNDVYLKLENLQTTGSFKIRGAYNKIYHLSEEERSRGVVASSAGNHSQGVAYAAKLLGVKATIFMPVFTPPSKIIATKSYGAEVQLYGETYDDAYKKAIEFTEKNNMVFIHPFNDPYVIAGQATIGLEIFEQIKDIDAVVVPIGGGGLISGIAFALKSLNHNIKIIGVEAEGAQSMKTSVEKGEIVPLVNLDTIADGIAVKIPGPLTFDMVKVYVDDLITVTDDEIAKAMYLLLTRNKIVAEPAGAVSLAATLSGKIKMKNKRICAVISGGNVDYNLLNQITQKGLVDEKLMVKVSVVIPDKPGSLKKILNYLSERQINVQDIDVERIEKDIPAGMAKIIITVQTIGIENIKAIEEFLKKEKIEYKLMT